MFVTGVKNRMWKFNDLKLGNGINFSLTGDIDLNKIGSLRKDEFNLQKETE